MSHWASLAIGTLYVGLMWHADGARSALTLCVPVAATIALIWWADAVAQYTGWAGRVSIDRSSPASLVRLLAWIALLAPGCILLWRYIRA